MFDHTEQEAIELITQTIAKAWCSGVSVSSSDLPQLKSQAAAYAVQQSVSTHLEWALLPEARRLWKVGGPHAQSTPTAACLPESLTHDSGASLLLSHPGLIGFEPEVAVRIAGVDVESGRARVSVDACCVAIEVVASRFADADNLDPLLKLADQQMNAALVLSSWCALPELPWAQIVCSVTRDGESVGKGEPGHPCGDPLWALDWLGDHAMQFGMPLRAGDVVTTGSWLGMLPFEGPGLFEAHFDGIGSASIQLT